jgi:hypothetical protein
VSACAESGLVSDRKTILLRVPERRILKSFVIPNRAESPVRNLLLTLPGSSPDSAPNRKFPMWKSSGNPVGRDD